MMIHLVPNWYQQVCLCVLQWEGEEGEEFKKSCATFCRDQSHALSYLRMRRRKDQKLANFLQVSIIALLIFWL